MTNTNSEPQLLAEAALFDSELKNLIATKKGQYVVVKAKEISDGYATESEAYAAALKKYGDEAFLIRQVTDEPQAPINVPAIWFGSFQ